MSGAAWLGAALEARRQGDGPAALRALEAARDAADTPRDLATACWRLAKAHLDFGSPQAMLDALEPLGDAPFAHYPRALAAMEPLARGWCDALGYGDARLLALWRAWDAAVGDPLWRARGQVARAWTHACRGELDQVAALVRHYEALRPADLARRAPDLKPHQRLLAAFRGELVDDRVPEGALYAVQLSLGRTLVRGATWVADERLAQEGLDAWEDAAALAEASPDPWLLEAAVHAVLTFGWPHDDWVEAHAAALADLGGERAEVHRPLGEALQAWAADDRELAAQHFLSSADAARETSAGPEWVVLGTVEAGRLSGSDALVERGLALAGEYGVGAWSPNAHRPSPVASR